MLPRQRAEKESAPTPEAGEPLPHANARTGSSRASLSAVKSLSSKYSPVSPVPVPVGGGPPRGVKVAVYVASSPGAMRS